MGNWGLKFSSARVSVALQTSTCLSSHKHFLEIATTTIHNRKKEINTNYISAIECYNVKYGYACPFVAIFNKRNSFNLIINRFNLKYIYLI